MLGLALAQFALKDYAGACATLDRLRAAHPDLDCPDGHLLYARSKEHQSEIEQALIEYAALAGYYPGEEARCRLALLLQKTGRVAEAKTLFQQAYLATSRLRGAAAGGLGGAATPVPGDGSKRMHLPPRAYSPRPSPRQCHRCRAPH